MSRASKLLAAAFVACVALGFLAGSVDRLESWNRLVLLIAIAAFPLAYISYRVDTRRYLQALAIRRAEKSAQHGVDLSAPAPLVPLGQLGDQRSFLLFYRLTGDLLGMLSGAQLRNLLEQHRTLSPDANDLYMLCETLEVLNERLDPAARELLENAFVARDDIELRWVPARFQT